MKTRFRPFFSSRHAVAITAAVAMAISLGACGYTPKLVSSPTGGKQPPALSETRINALVNEANQVAAAGDAAKDWQQLAPRFLNPALAMRNGEYRVASVANGATVKPLPLAKPQIMTVSQAGSWPRYLFTVSAGAQNEAPQMFAFVQSQARANYGLWGHVRLFPKAKFPATFKPEVGSPAVPAKSKELVVNPGAVAAAYVKVLNNPGDSAKNRFDFGADSFVAAYNHRRDSYQQLASKSHGLQVNVNAKLGAGFVGLGTISGEALIMAELQYDVTMKSSRPLNLNPVAQAWVGKNTATSTLNETHTALVLFKIPKRGHDAKIRALGAAEAVTAMSAD